MKKLELWYPISPMKVNQFFGTVDPKYTKLKMKGHNGIDFWADDGRNVRAAHEGEVTYAGLDGSNGELIVLRTLEPFEYGDTAVYFKTLYGHLKRGTYRVRPNQTVKAGDVLAQADNTGLSTGTHLHFGLKPQEYGEANWQWFNLEQDNGYNGAIDPWPYFNGYTAYEATNLMKTIAALKKTLDDLLRKVAALSEK